MKEREGRKKDRKCGEERKRKERDKYRKEEEKEE